jgi:excisionase family DNA binding protein
MPDFERPINLDAAAELLGIHVVTLRRWAAEGKVPCAKLGHRWKFRVSSLDEWMRQQEQSQTQPRR